MKVNSIQDVVKSTICSSIIIAEVKDESSRQIFLPRFLSALKEAGEKIDQYDFYQYDEFYKFTRLVKRDGAEVDKLSVARNFNKTVFDTGASAKPEDILNAMKTAMCCSPSIVQFHIDDAVFCKSKTLINLIKTFVRDLSSFKQDVKDGKQILTSEQKSSKFYDQNKNVQALNYRDNSFLIIITNNLANFEDLDDVALLLKEETQDSKYVTSVFDVVERKVANAKNLRAELERFLKPLNLSSVVSFAYSLTNEEKLAKRKLTEDEIRSFMKNFLIATLTDEELLEKMESDYGFEAIGGYDEVKEHIRKNVVNLWKNKDKVEQYKLQIDSGIILFGGPGVGKSMFASCLAHELKIPAYRLNISKILDKFVGESEKKLQAVIDTIEKVSPSLLFIDEIDSMASSRELGGVVSATTKVDRNILNMLLQYISNPNRQAIIIGATNLIYEIDSALMRKGRLGTKIYVPFPDEEARKSIIKIHLEVKRAIPHKISINAIAEKTANMTGAEIESLINEIGVDVLIEQGKKEVTTDDILAGLEKFQLPPYRDQEIKRHNYIASLFSSFKIKGITDAKYTDNVIKDTQGLFKNAPKNVGDWMNN